MRKTNKNETTQLYGTKRTIFFLSPVFLLLAMSLNASIVQYNEMNAERESEGRERERNKFNQSN